MLPNTLTLSAHHLVYSWLCTCLSTGVVRTWPCLWARRLVPPLPLLLEDRSESSCCCLLALCPWARHVASIEAWVTAFPPIQIPFGFEIVRCALVRLDS